MSLRVEFFLKVGAENSLLAPCLKLPGGPQLQAFHVVDDAWRWNGEGRRQWYQLGEPMILKP